MIAIGVLGWTATDWILFRWSQPPIVPAAAPGSPQATRLSERLTKYFIIKSSRDRKRRLLGGWLIFLPAVAILVFPSLPNVKRNLSRNSSPENSGQVTQPSKPGEAPPPGADPASKFISPLMWICGLAMVCGTLIAVLARDRVTKMVGAGTVLLSLGANGAIIKELKIGDIVKIDTLKLDAEINSRLQEIGNLGPEHIESIGGFIPGKAEITPAMQEAIDDACSKLKAETTGGKEGLLLIVGSTDRVPLRHSALKQYESNFGLARARAESVKLKLSSATENSANIANPAAATSGIKCGIPVSKMLALVSGPEHTPELVLPKYDGVLLSNDRSVDLWALWAWHEPRGKHSSFQATVGHSDAGSK